MVTDKQKNLLFINVTDVNNGTWLINKREILHAYKGLSSNVTRVELTNGEKLDTYTTIFQISAEVSEIEHKIEPEAKP